MFLEVKFVGGLGNQLFQYATARKLCLRKNIPILLLGTESYNKDALGRKFILPFLNIIGLNIKTSILKKILHHDSKFNSLLTSLNLYKGIIEKGLVLQTITDKKYFLLSLSGYWQSAYYFDDIREVLLKEFTPSNLPIFPNWIDMENTVSIHIRRKDYIDENRYGVLDRSYYEKAIMSMKKLLLNPLFIFFSDDINWCKENFSGTNFIYCDDSNWEKDYLQLHLMSACKNQIIANSTFSWWGAWLNVNPNKIIIRPLTPFKDMSLLYEAHYPSKWISISNTDNKLQ